MNPRVGSATRNKLALWMRKERPEGERAGRWERERRTAAQSQCDAASLATGGESQPRGECGRGEGCRTEERAIIAYNPMLRDVTTSGNAVGECSSLSAATGGPCSTLLIHSAHCPCALLVSSCRPPSLPPSAATRACEWNVTNRHRLAGPAAKTVAQSQWHKRWSRKTNSKETTNNGSAKE